MIPARSLFAALPLLFCFSHGASSAAGELPLPEKILPALDPILRSAVQQSPRMVSQALEWEIAEQDRIQARAALLPTVGGYVREAETRDRRYDLHKTLTTQKLSYDVAATQPLFFWGERQNTARIGEIRAKIAAGQYREAYRLLAQEIRSQYLLLIMTKITLGRAHFYQKFASDQAKIAEERYTRKLISEAQVADARLTDERGLIGLERAQLEYDNLKQSFAHLTGLPPLEDDAVPDQFPKVTIPDAPCDQLLAEFLSQKDPPTQSADALRQQIEIENLNYENAKTRLRPKVSGSIGANQDEQRYGATVGKYQVNSLYAGITVNWNIFDGFATGAAVRASLARHRQLENNYKILTEQLASQAQWQRKMVYFAGREMTIDDRSLDANEGDYRNKQDDFKRGSISEADLSVIRLNLYELQGNVYRARFDFLIKLGDFVGLLDQDPVLVNVPASPRS